MKAYPFEPRLLHQFDHSCANAIRAVVFAFRPAEHEIIFPIVLAEHFPVTVLYLAMLRECVQCRGRNLEPARLLRLGGLDPQTGFRLFEGFCHAHDTGLEIDISPLEREQLAAAGASRQAEHYKWIEARFPGAREKGTDAILLNYSGVFLRQLRQFNSVHRVARDELPLNGLFETAMHNAGDVPNALWRQRPSGRMVFRLLAAVVKQAANHKFHLHRPELVERDRAERALFGSHFHCLPDRIGPELAIALDRLRGALARSVFSHPALEEFRECRQRRDDFRRMQLCFDGGFVFLYCDPELGIGFRLRSKAGFSELDPFPADIAATIEHVTP
ncbi:MAG TPA: hypothetical protein VG273_21875 [Bryobacteraceae bacterium]|nr:hypothetical protein [Bryobacteraceae bacterium]